MQSYMILCIGNHICGYNFRYHYDFVGFPNGALSPGLIQMRPLAGLNATCFESNAAPARPLSMSAS